MSKKVKANYVYINMRACPVCRYGGPVTPLRHFALSTPPGNPCTDGFDLISCTQCGFSYADFPTSQSDIDRYYEECSKYEFTPGPLAGCDQDRFKWIADFLKDKGSCSHCVFMCMSKGWDCAISSGFTATF